MNKLMKVEVYTDDDKKPTTPKRATVRYVTIFKEGIGIKRQYQEYSEEGWKINTKNFKVKYYKVEKATEEFVEDEHPREDDGKFTDKGGGVGSSTRTKTRRRKSRSKTPKYKPKQYDTPFSWRDTSKPLSSKQKFNYRSRKTHKELTYQMQQIQNL